jgi:putative sterol carrier protein
LQYLSRVVQHFGGYDTTHIGLQVPHLRHFPPSETTDEGDFIREFIEKELEDFYRALRQNRRMILPQDYAKNAAEFIPPAASPGKQIKTSPAAPVKVEKVAKRLDAFTEQQEREIEELSRLFAEKYTDADDEGDDNERKTEVYEDEEEEEVILPPPKPVKAAPSSRKKTARQLTQNLPHYFQPQLSAGTQAVMQISITGAGAFEGYLSIRSKECTYTDGTAEAPDVTVIADSALWMDVLNAKFTAQKAFMIGGLKVRGALALFTKFDTLFKLG